MQCHDCSVPFALRLAITPSPKTLLTMQAYLSNTIETPRPKTQAPHEASSLMVTPPAPVAPLPITAPMPTFPPLVSPPTTEAASDTVAPGTTLNEPELIYSADGGRLIGEPGTADFPYRVTFLGRGPIEHRDILDLLRFLTGRVPIVGTVRAGVPSFLIPDASPEFIEDFNACVDGYDLVRIEEESYIDHGIRPGDVLLVDTTAPRRGLCRLYDKPVAMIDTEPRAHFGWYAPHKLRKYHEVRNTLGMEVVGVVAAHCLGL